MYKKASVILYHTYHIFLIKYSKGQYEDNELVYKNMTQYFTIKLKTTVNSFTYTPNPSQLFCSITQRSYPQSGTPGSKHRNMAKAKFNFRLGTIKKSLVTRFET